MTSRRILPRALTLDEGVAKIALVHDSSAHIHAIQQALRQAKLDGWLFYDFRGSDPLAYRVLRVDPMRHITRRWYYWLPATGRPIKLVHRIEPQTLDDIPGDAITYVS